MILLSIATSKLRFNNYGYLDFSVIGLKHHYDKINTKRTSLLDTLHGY